MSKPLSELRRRIVPKEEVGQSVAPSRKSLLIEEAVQLFIDENTGQPIQVGEAVEFGDYETPTEGTTYWRYIMPDVYKHEKLGWHKNKKSKSQRVVSIEAKPNGEGKYVVWITRLL